MEALEWIAEAKKRCGILGRAHGWHWSVDEEVDSDLFPALEGQLSLPDTTLVPNNSNALILHPRLRHFTSALAGDPDPYPRVFRIQNAIPGSARVSATG